MALLGEAALAMWWDMAPDMRDEFQHWHTHEHFPERLALPGFRRASRWESADGGEGFFILYELASFDALTSPEYLARLNAPSIWSTKLMPYHRNMVRSQCRVVASSGAGVAGHALTLRLASGGHRLELDTQELALRPGLGGVHLLQTETPAIAATTEQKIRGNADLAADAILVVCGYDEQALRGLLERELADHVREGGIAGVYRLAMSMTSGVEAGAQALQGVARWLA